MVYLDLDELPALIGRRRPISDSRYATASFLRSDHLYDTSRSLTDEVRQIVQEQTARWPRGPIRLLTQLRYFGYYMSPLNLFYVFDERGQSVESVVAEVNNTPWNERHCYVLWHGNRVDPPNVASTRGPPEPKRTLAFAHAKDFHVSPFIAMDTGYRWRLTEPGKGLEVQLAGTLDSRPILEAGLSLRRRQLSQRQMRRMTLRYPFMTAQIIGAIYYQAFQLWWKKCPSYKHPKKFDPAPTKSPRSPAERDTVLSEPTATKACSGEPSCAGWRGSARGD